MGEKIIFLGVALLGVVICVMLIIMGVRINTSSLTGGECDREFYVRTHNRVQRFYEMMISATSVMSFACVYVIINHIYTLITEGAAGGGYEDFVNIWENGRDFILLLLICLSCVLNTLLDKVFIPLKRINKEEKASIRMLAMFYVIIILVYLNQIGDASEYSPVMMYYLGLMVGRFVYFDASFTDFLNAFFSALKNAHLLVMGLMLTGVMCYVGFSAGYLLERNYYIVGAFYTHLFILVAIFILHLSHVLNFIIREPAGDEELHHDGIIYDDISDGNNDGYDSDEYEDEYDDDEYDRDGYDDGYDRDRYDEYDDGRYDGDKYVRDRYGDEYNDGPDRDKYKSDDGNYARDYESIDDDY
ncbi:MAG: hypothetical protein K6G03_00555 [Lachnospiraceae bacterium]|nr:hypothetical protein [Lachnospiraceae bacterium]